VERRYNYIRREYVLQFITSNPGCTATQMCNRFNSDVTCSLRKLLSEGKVLRRKETREPYLWFTINTNGGDK
jgi:hypothetical protein